MGQCYENEQIKSKAAAIRCYTRAVDSGDREGAQPQPDSPLLHLLLLQLYRVAARS